MKDNPRFPHQCIIRRPVYREMTDEALADELPLVDEDETEIVYKGKCRSYSSRSVSDTKEVIVSERTLSLPVIQSKWPDFPNIPAEGDYVEITYQGYKEYGIITDRRPGNLGTHLTWKFIRN